jgi:hypothetical protein
MAWHWDSAKGRRVRARGRLAAWIDRRDPFLSGLLIGVLAAVGLWLAGASPALIGFGGLSLGASAGALVELCSEGVTAADLALPNPVELTPADVARADAGEGWLQALESVSDGFSGDSG